VFTKAITPGLADWLRLLAASRLQPRRRGLRRLDADALGVMGLDCLAKLWQQAVGGVH